jgi:hypothetical protein
MNDKLALVGQIIGEAEPRDVEAEALRMENRRLRRELQDAQTNEARAREDAQRALLMLRQQLGPLYRALQAVFGELDAAGVADDVRPSAVVTPGAGASGMDPRKAAVWDAWKQRLGGQCAKVIDALLLHSDMNSTQLAIAIGTRRQNIPSLIYKLNQAGLINKNGGRFSLKQL